MSADWNAETYAAHFSFVPDYGREVIKLIKGEKLRVLEIGRASCRERV